MVSGSGVDALKASMQNSLIAPFVFVEEIEAGMESGDSKKKQFGQDLLHLYFWQIFGFDTCFLDLRDARFTSQTDQQIAWRPTGLYHRFAPEFMVAVRQLYRGFYLDNQELVTKSARDLGLITADFTAEQTKSLLDLLQSHFGDGRTRDVLFTLEDFTHSFDKLFSFLKQNKVQIGSDFLFLGVYLVTLYISLSKVGVPLSPRKAIQPYLD
jgi:predicted unusual protein kinase regulating ubiquinone biosynthesis (AarF/ABC1/UbiB family)